ncbi:MAG: hybrid sensor histidine kinase/response regulator [Magnetospirillum sp.]|nr:hybrid sensor histidine kinase/response regulator [Magnetospirillum sp.]
MDTMVAAELIRVLYRQTPAMLAANLVNSGLVSLVLWSDADRRILLGWASAIWLHVVVRGFQWYAYPAPPLAPTGPDAISRWRGIFTSAATIFGLSWGGAALLLIRGGDPLSLILIAFVIGGMAAGAIASLSCHLPALYLYLATSTLPLAARLLAGGDRTSLAMAGMCAVYVGALAIIARNVNTSLIRALELNEENRRLLANMDGEVRLRTRDLQAANARLENEIAERKQAESAMMAARAEAENANQAKSRFLAAASHDLRQPLQAMLLYAHALRRHVVGEKGIDALVRIEHGLDVLKGLLDSLLDLSRLDVNVTQPQIATFPLMPLLDDIAASYQRIAAIKGIRLETGPLADVAVRSDRTLLGRMVRNLVENAVRYTDVGHVTLSCHRSGQRVRIAVEDTGIGIAPDQLGRIFEEFHQVGNPERDRTRGLGLGLAIVQRLSAILDHPVSVQSELGRGSTFSIEVPLAASKRAARTAEPPGAAAPRAVGRRIALIDDDPLVLLALSSVLEGWGYAVTMAGSEEEIVAQFPQSAPPPELIIADYRLKSAKIGTDAIKALRATVGLPVPGIVLTGETGTECADDAKALGALVLHKPVTPNQLRFALDRLFGEQVADARERGPSA